MTDKEIQATCEYVAKQLANSGLLGVTASLEYYLRNKDNINLSTVIQEQKQEKIVQLVNAKADIEAQLTTIATPEEVARAVEDLH